MLVFIVGIIVFTAVFGCVRHVPERYSWKWCFVKYGDWIEGDSMEQKQLVKASWSGKKIFKRTVNCAIFPQLSSLVLLRLSFIRPWNQMNQVQ